MIEDICSTALYASCCILDFSLYSNSNALFTFCCTSCSVLLLSHFKPLQFDSLLHLRIFCRSRNMSTNVFRSSSSSSSSNIASCNTILTPSLLLFLKAAKAAAVLSDTSNRMRLNCRLRTKSSRCLLLMTLPDFNRKFLTLFLQATSNRRQSGFLLSPPLNVSQHAHTAAALRPKPSSSSQSAASTSSSLPPMQQSLLIRARQIMQGRQSKDVIMRSLFSLCNCAASGSGHSSGSNAPVPPGSSFVCVGVCRSHFYDDVHSPCAYCPLLLFVTFCTPRPYISHSTFHR
jgi:hypothetical protein